MRAYLLLSDTLPKPVPFPDESLRQFAELREVVTRTEVYFQAQLQQLQVDLRDPDRDNVRRYADDNLKLGAPQASNPRVVFLGDSITDGWRLNEYFPNRDFLNRGISGQITSQMLGRFLNDVVSVRPSAVVILAGTNDIGRGVDIVTVESNLTAICGPGRSLQSQSDSLLGTARPRLQRSHQSSLRAVEETLAAGDPHSDRLAYGFLPEARLCLPELLPASDGRAHDADQGVFR